MKRDPGDPTIVSEICTAEAMEHLRMNDLCNPHQLVRDARKAGLRLRFFESFLDGTKIFLVNTNADPRTTQAAIRKALEDQR
jgi:hypothetical protein